MYRRGIVSATDPATGRVRVRFPDRDNLESWWLEVARPAAHQNRAYWMPDLGETLAVVMDDRDEAGVVIGALSSQADPPPVASQDKWQVRMGDGATFEYDRASHELAIAVPAGGKVTFAVGGSRIEITEQGITQETPGQLELRGQGLSIVAPGAGKGWRATCRSGATCTRPGM